MAELKLELERLADEKPSETDEKLNTGGNPMEAGVSSAFTPDLQPQPMTINRHAPVKWVRWAAIGGLAVLIGLGLAFGGSLMIRGFHGGATPTLPQAAILLPTGTSTFTQTYTPTKTPESTATAVVVTASTSSLGFLRLGPTFYIPMCIRL